MTVGFGFNPEHAHQRQLALAGEVILEDFAGPIVLVGGVDVAYSNKDNRLAAAAVVSERTNLEVIEEAVVEGIVDVPYLPGLLGWREAPSVLDALRRLRARPDVVICDGQGIAHPSRFGLACHVGVQLDLPTIGCAKNHLVGDYEPVGNDRGDGSFLMIDGEQVGMVVRTQTGVKPLFVSPGHRITVQRAADMILELAPRFRLPEIIRSADQLARRRLRSR